MKPIAGSRSQRRPDADATDDDLVALARHDPDAFALLFDRYAAAVYRYCLVCLRSREDAEDATADTFEKAFRKLAQYRPGSFRAWLFTIARHAVVDRLRDQRPHRPLDDVVLLVEDRGPTPGEQAERHRVLWSLLAELPDGQRDVLELRLAGLKGVEIASVLATSEDAVKQRQARGEANLRRLWEANYGDR